MQVFNYKPSQEKMSFGKIGNYFRNSSASSILKDVTNMLSAEPKFDNPHNYLRHYYNEWEADDMALFRFIVPSKPGMPNMQ